MKVICRRSLPPRKFLVFRSLYASREVESNLSLSTSTRWRTYSTEKTWTPHTLPVQAIRNAKNNAIPESNTGTIKKAYIAFGSNMGDRIGWIEQACNLMSSRGIKLLRTSSLWETEPMYVLDQENFLNGVCEVETNYSPLALLDELQSIENELGRKKVIDKGPRNIDLDILLYADEVFKHQRLTIPHASMLEREFVLRPLNELIPNEALDQKLPWKLTQDYLNALPMSSPPLSTITPLTSSMEPLRPLKPTRRTNIMLILNATPDSFSGEKVPTEWLDRNSNTAKSIKDLDTLIIDIGGQSTAPGATPVNATEELNRILPVLNTLRDPAQGEQLAIERRHLAISVDTFYASVAEAAIQAGADIINDVSAGQLDPAMLETVAKSNKTICLMHMRGNPQTMSTLTSYPDGLIPTIATELLARVADAEAAGIRRWRIILDPGIGFAKTTAQNLEILRRLDELREWPGLRGIPWLLGTSRKRFIGEITKVDDPTKRGMGTAATVAASVLGGADIVRVHDSLRMAQVAMMADAIWRVDRAGDHST